MMPKHKAKRDANQAAIVAALEKIGAIVVDTSQVGKSFPDLVVGLHGQTYLLEIKTPKGKLSPGQDAFISAWRGGPVYVVRSPEEAVSLIGTTVMTYNVRKQVKP